MFTCGGAMSGYCSIGRLRMLKAPASMMTMAMTQAKTGRSMKMREIMPRSAPRAGVGARLVLGDRLRRARRHRPHLLAGLDAVEALGDHPLARLEPGGHQPARADGARRRDRPRHGAVLGVQHQDARIALRIAGDRLLRNQD